MYNEGVSHHEHKHAAPAALRVAVVTVSDTRTPETDEGGRLVATLCEAAGHAVVARDLFPDEPAQVTGHVRRLVLAGGVDAILVTGGTGISHRDTTIEALVPLFEKRIDGYGELFRALSFQEIGPAAMLSRAVAGTMGAVVVFSMPGSPAGVRLALDKLVLPELPHVVSEIRRGVSDEHHAHHAHRHGPGRA